MRPVGLTSSRRLLSLSAIRTGAGRTDGSEPGARLAVEAGVRRLVWAARVEAAPWWCWTPPPPEASAIAPSRRAKICRRVGRLLGLLMTGDDHGRRGGAHR